MHKPSDDVDAWGWDAEETRTSAQVARASECQKEDENLEEGVGTRQGDWEHG